MSTAKASLPIRGERRVNRGAYLVTGARSLHRVPLARATFSAASSGDADFAGARIPEGKGTVPNITPSERRHRRLERGGYRLSARDREYARTYDVIGESMAPVQENMAKLTPEDRNAIAAYIKSLPPRPDAVPKSEQKDEAGRRRRHGIREEGFAGFSAARIPSGVKPDILSRTAIKLTGNKSAACSLPRLLCHH